MRNAHFAFLLFCRVLRYCALAPLKYWLLSISAKVQWSKRKRECPPLLIVMSSTLRSKIVGLKNDFWPHMLLGLRRWHVCRVDDFVFTIQYFICSRVYSTALSTVLYKKKPLT